MDTTEKPVPVSFTAPPRYRNPEKNGKNLESSEYGLVPGRFVTDRSIRVASLRISGPPTMESVELLT